LAFMATLAQCEKAVTISEPMGCTAWSSKAIVSSKDPLCFPTRLSGGRIPAGSKFSLPDLFFSVFNDLRGLASTRGRQFRNILRYLQNRAFVLLRSGWFGPSFVTIMPTGVGVCSF
jgi:hypothetical protein